ncbi:hypothetical protein CEXT_51571 [Caerostris extrusa]|uniref:Uncharacterized protein n=1 Tax=Caerostris extrusa TaxID=172846 RepID=A0AAV4N856_CAEEX|nr:hypothetical protein CEXT_51571 [Caerostris extrusa]
METNHPPRCQTESAGMVPSCRPAFNYKAISGTDGPSRGRNATGRFPCSAGARLSARAHVCDTQVARQAEAATILSNKLSFLFFFFSPYPLKSVNGRQSSPCFLRLTLFW